MHRTIILAVIAVLVFGGSAIKISAQTAPAPPTRAELAQKLLNSRAGQFMTAPARKALEAVAHGDSSLSHTADQGNNANLAQAQLAQGGAAPSGSGLSNVRVNDPGEDTHQVDQTTQSETSVAVSGSNVAAGFNDSQATLPFLTAGTNLTGYAYSHDGGSTWHDGGVLPNAGGYMNLGDPWLASDRSGSMYYSTLSLSLTPERFFDLDVGVAKSTNGGQSWSQPVIASSSLGNQFGYSADKDAMTVGRDPKVATRDDVYAGWDDFTIDPSTFTFYSGLPVARSTDGGQTFQITYANKVPIYPPPGPTPDCSFQQYIGSQPLVDPKDGTLYLAAEKLVVNDPTCTFTAPLQANQVIFVSKDGGQTFGPETLIANGTPAMANGYLKLGSGQYMRTIEFPVLALFKNALYAAWNDGGSSSGGSVVHSHIRLAKSTDGGNTWTTAFITQGNGDELQPAISADSALHIAYYQRNQNNTLDVYVSDSPNGSNFSAQRVTSQSFPGALTFPQFDPIIAFAYMGDYITNVSDGSHQYFAWGDNRDTVTSFLYPQGRNDPDVFFARR